MRTLTPAALVVLAGLSLAGQSTGRIQGKVTNTAGKPVPNVKIKVSRIDISWIKEIKVDGNGSFLQVGLDPKQFNMEVEAEGFVKQQKQIKIPLGEALTENIILLTPEEAAKANPAAVVADPAASMEAKASAAYNNAVTLINAQKFVEALPLLDEAVTNMNESITKTKDEKIKAEITERLAKVERVHAICLFEVGAGDEAQRKAIWERAESVILKIKTREPKDDRWPTYMARIAEFKGDAEASKKFEAEAEAIIGPRPEKAYNAAVEAFNKGDNAVTKKQCEKAIGIDPKYAEAYYLLAMAEFGLGNMKATKTSFQKYLELAPNGKHAAEVSEMLKDPSLKNIK